MLATITNRVEIINYCIPHTEDSILLKGIIKRHRSNSAAVDGNIQTSHMHAKRFNTQTVNDCACFDGRPETEAIKLVAQLVTEFSPWPLLVMLSQTKSNWGISLVATILPSVDPLEAHTHTTHTHTILSHSGIVSSFRLHWANRLISCPSH